VEQTALIDEEKGTFIFAHSSLKCQTGIRKSQHFHFKGTQSYEQIILRFVYSIPTSERSRGPKRDGD
jgi:hypothetical protein